MVELMPLITQITCMTFAAFCGEKAFFKDRGKESPLSILWTMLFGMWVGATIAMTVEMISGGA